jgi:hypothetical protein
MRGVQFAAEYGTPSEVNLTTARLECSREGERVHGGDLGGTTAILVVQRAVCVGGTQQHRRGKRLDDMICALVAKVSAGERL